MVVMYEIKMEVLSEEYNEDELRNIIKDILKYIIDVSHIQVESSEKKCKDWIIDEDAFKRGY